MSSSNRIGDWILTFSGVKFYPLDPRPEEIHIKDIAHALSMQCRFSGHTRHHFSVAQHSLMVSRMVAEVDGMWGLLHDASEAYLVDLPRPLKNNSELGTAYRKIEDRLMQCVVERFDLYCAHMPDSVKEADNRTLMTERRDLMPESDPWVSIPELPYRQRIEQMDTRQVEAQFLNRFYYLDRERGVNG